MRQDVYQRLHDLEDRHWWFRARRDIVSAVLSRVIAAGTRPRILEVGCGTGGNLSMLARFGEVSGFEPDEGALALANSKCVCVLQAGSLPDRIPAYERPFELIVALDVMEHVEDDLQSFKELRSNLVSGGRLLLTVPAYDFLWSRHDDEHHHFRRYTKARVENVLSRSGYRVEYVTYYNAILFPLVVVVRMAKKYLRLNGAHDDSMPSALLNSLLRAAFASERSVIGRLSLPFGVSILAVASNPR